jgi:phosphatidylinositol 3-kinase
VEKLLPLWGQEIGVDDALELLGPGFTDKRVRAFAVKRLERADDDVSLLGTPVVLKGAHQQELLLYLLQLVQALRFETTHDTRKRRKAVEEEDSGLSQFLIDRSVVNPLLGTSFHWYLMIECDTRSPVGKSYAKVAFRFMQKLSEVSPTVR